MTINFETNRHLRDFSTMGIGGLARFFVTVRTVEEMKTAILQAKMLNLPFFILGKGSNCLFDDKGFNGVVILNKIDFTHEIQPGIFHVGAGYSFSLLGTQTARQGWGGMEFASGIPGSVGGAVFMNAGANKNETCDHLLSVEFLHSDGTIQTYSKSEMQFSYRFSCFQEMSGAIISATFGLSPSQEARKKQIDLVTYRKNTQPYGEKSAGCVFRNPEGQFAGALIEQCGLKGNHIGDAVVSLKHANFLVNRESASCQEILSLIQKISREVKSKTGYELQMEIKYIPYQELDE